MVLNPGSSSKIPSVARILGKIPILASNDRDSDYRHIIAKSVGGRLIHRVRLDYRSNNIAVERYQFILMAKE
jgi:hypothetical protein